MKRGKKAIALLLAVLVCGNLFACGGKSRELGVPARAEALSHEERLEADYRQTAERAEAFAPAFAAAAYRIREAADGNVAVAPVSVFMAMSLAAVCAGGETREEILSALGLSYGELRAGFSAFYRSLTAEFTTNTGDLEGELALGNSILLNEETAVNGDCIRTLSEDFFCYSYAADFLSDNRRANRAVRDFVKEQTRGMIDRDFALQTDTLFALINTLYLKDIWREYGKKLSFTAENYEFTECDGATRAQKLLVGNYAAGRVSENERYATFFARTYNGFRLQFILPKNGYSVDEVFTAASLAEAAAITDWGAVDEENRIRYYTRCLFPAFEASFDGEVKSLLQDAFGIRSLFDRDTCDLSSLSENRAYCSRVRHAAELKVNERGIEGAAVTVMTFPGAGDPGPDPYEDVFLDFVVDGAFGFILSDPYGVTLFSGVVNRL